MKIQNILTGVAIASAVAFAPTAAQAQVVSTPVSATEATLSGDVVFTAPVVGTVEIQLPSQEVQIPAEALFAGSTFSVLAPITNNGSVDSEVTPSINGTVPNYLTITTPAPATIATGGTETFSFDVVVNATADVDATLVLDFTAAIDPNTVVTGGTFTF